MRIILFVLFLFLPALNLAEEVDYYVDNVSGTDEPAFGGVQDSSWKTITYAFNRLWNY